MADEGVNIREMLIERIRDLRKLKSETLQGSNYRNLEDLEMFNMKLYYFIFKREI